MKTPHKHAELIKAWADGADIEHFSVPAQIWMYTAHPAWNPENQYRIKPPEDVVAYGRVRWAGYGNEPRVDSIGGIQGTLDNIKLVFDGTTFTLKHAEVV